MNERIRELSYEAQRYSLNKITGPDLAGINELWQEKFAELIVEECIEVCKSRVGNSDYNTGRMHCVSDLKEHFGVE